MKYFQSRKFAILFVLIFYLLSFPSSSSFAKELTDKESAKRELAIEEAVAKARALKEKERVFGKRQAVKKDILEPIEKEGITTKISGYYKNLFVVSKTLDTKENFFSDSQRLRLKFEVNPGPQWHGVVVFDNDLLLNDFADTSDFDLIRDANQGNLAFLDLDKAVVDENHLYIKESLYRAYIEYYNPKFQFVLGKQKIDWGRLRFWSPMDLFNQISPLALEREERVGVDALNLDFYLSPKWNLNVVYAPDESSAESGAGARVFGTVGNYDLFFMAGEFRKDEVFGSGFDGSLGEAGFRGEFTYTLQDNEKDSFRGVVGADYNFTDNIYLLAEYFYNGGAEDNDTAFFSSNKFANRVLTQKKHLFGLWLEYEMTPLLYWDNYFIYDFEGKSAFLNPEFTYNIWTNFDFSFGAQLFLGDNAGEFGQYQHLYYSQAQYFF